MNCLNCGRPRGAGQKVCLTCGESFPLKSSAGRRRSSSGARAERRSMSALFCDLVNSVGLSEQLDPEDLLSVYDLYRACCEEVVADHRGFLAQYLGDGILAYFGYPRADEDDAANAVRAGLALLDRIALLKTGLDSPLRARVGIATGLVVVTESVGRDAAGAPSIVGQMPNLAARLQSLATPNSVVIAETTRKVTRGLFTYRDLGAQALKGFTKPVQAWEVVAATATESRFEAHVEGVESPFTGRDGELDRLLRSWKSACGGLGGAALLLGEPGIGKSRLIKAFEDRLDGAPRVRVRWFCSPQRVESPLYPVIDQIERDAGIDRVDSPTDKRAKLEAFVGEVDEQTFAAIAALLSIPLDRASQLDAVTPEKRKELVTRALLGLLGRLAERMTVMIVVEDVHWVDASSLDLLERLIDQCGERRMLLLVTARPEFKPRWTDRACVTLMRLEPLDRTSAAALCTHMAGVALRPEVQRQILARGEGNPLFVEELTRTVLEAVRAGDNNDGGGVLIPETLHDSLVARLDRLGPLRQLANVGAAIGRRFEIGLLAEVLETSTDKLRADLQPLIQARLVTTVGAPPTVTYLFRHALIRDAAYDSLLRTDRQKLHARIATAIQAKFPEFADSEPEVVAYHLGESGAEAEALPYWERAGLRFSARGAHEEAVRHYGAALSILLRLPEDVTRAQRELRLLISLARSLSTTVGLSSDAYRDVLDRAHALCGSLGNETDLFPVLRGLCNYMILSGNVRAGKQLADRIVQLGEQTGHVPCEIEGYTILGFVSFYRAEFARARLYLERSLSLYMQHMDERLEFPTHPDPRVASASVLATVLQYLAEPEGARQRGDEALDWARSLAHPFDIAYALNWAAGLAMGRGDLPLAVQHSQEAITLSEFHGLGAMRVQARSSLACAIGLMGDSEDAIVRLEEVLELFRQGGLRTQITAAIGQLAVSYAAVGRIADALATIDRAIAHAVEYEDLTFLSGLHLYRAHILRKADDCHPTAVEEALREARSIAEAQGAIIFARRAHTLLQRVPASLASRTA